MGRLKIFFNMAELFHSRRGNFSKFDLTYFPINSVMSFYLILDYWIVSHTYEVNQYLGADIPHGSSLPAKLCN